MRVLVRKGLLTGILQWARRLFSTAAILLLGYCVFVVVDAWVFQKRESGILQRMLKDNRQAVTNSPFRPATTPGPLAIAVNGLIGRMEIPRLGLSVVVMEGDQPTTLRRAVGHIPGTPLPGQTGNVVLTGHRDTFFRPLRNIRRNDVIVVTTLQGEYRYRVVSTKVVDSLDVAVLDPSGNEILTLVTCYPFYYVGSAPDRFIVRAERVGNTS
jgi:sortase A